MDGPKRGCGIAALDHFDETLPSRVYDGDPDQTHALIPRVFIDLQGRGRFAVAVGYYEH